MKKLSYVSCVAFINLLIGCGINDSIQSEKQFNQSQSKNLHLELVSGDSQAAMVGQTVMDPLTVKVVDENRTQVDENQIVQFEIVSGDASLLGKTAISPTSEGLVSIKVQLGLSPTVVLVKATLNVPVFDVAKHEVLFTLKSDPPIGPRLVIQDGASNGQHAIVKKKLPIPLSVIAQGRDGSPVAGQSIQFLITKGWADMSITPAVTTDSRGVASADLFMGTHVGEVEVQAYWPMDVEEPINRTVIFTAIADPDAPVSIVFESGIVVGGKPACALEETGFNQSVVVKLSDKYGNAIQGQAISVDPDTLSAVDSLAYGAPKTFQTDMDGRASFSLKAGKVLTGNYYGVSTVVASIVGSDGTLGTSTYANFNFTKANSLLFDSGFNADPYGSNSYNLTSLTGSLKFPVKINGVRSCWQPAPNVTISVYKSTLGSNLCPRVLTNWPAAEVFGTMITNSSGVASSTATVNVFLGTPNSIIQTYASRLEFSAPSMNNLYMYVSYQRCM